MVKFFVKLWKIVYNKILQNLDLVILAGGLGSRIKNVTKKKPKPLIKFGKLSFLRNLINHYAKYSFNKIYIIAGYKGELIKEEFNNKLVNLTKIECIIEKKLKGTGGALSELKKKKIRNFILINGDSFCPIDILKFTKKVNNKLIKMSLVKNIYYKSNTTLNNLNLKKNKVVFNKKSNLMNAGIYYINKKILKKISKKRKSLEGDYLNNLILKNQVYGEKFNNKLIDIGTAPNLNIAKIELPKIFKKPAIFLDRDGVINYDYGYVNTLNKFKLKKGVIKGLQYLSTLKCYIFIVTNQAGIAHGYYKERNFLNFQKNINENFTKKKIFINDVLYCPHHIEGIVKKFAKNCKCRKPKTFMLKKISNTFDINLKKSFFIGDKVTDKTCAERFGINFYYSNKNFFTIVKNKIDKIS